MNQTDHSRDWQQQIQEHHAKKSPLMIIGGNSKAFYGRRADATQVLQTRAHCGVIEYEPAELVITARAGTPLREIETTLAQHQQMLGFEPPHFGEHATLGGCIAAGLSGPRRPYSGSLRDHVLGVTVINGRAEQLHFGGKVMKNVAGYDLARLYAGSLGTLGVILDVSLKVLPLPETELTLRFEMHVEQALAKMQQIAPQPLPLSAACYDGAELSLRLSGTPQGVQHARSLLGGESVPKADHFWRQVREQTHPFFQHPQPLWRIAVPPATSMITLGDAQWIDWGGAQRWMYSETSSEAIFSLAQQHGGHASLFRGGEQPRDVFQPLHGKLKELHVNTKLAFDPLCLFNPGRMYSYY
ncbi:MAG: glycolate oxidase subunit GlcE [Gammaproteobacteria bacterium]|nr:glycolate oxidase subunit GlcE [Gammaproteobacteria bacterium]